jgi:excisionase family DNA binding protein
MNGNDDSTVRLAEKATLSLDEAARLAGCGRSTIYRSIRNGTLVARKMRTRTVILRTDLDQWLAALPVKAVSA